MKDKPKRTPVDGSERVKSQPPAANTKNNKLASPTQKSLSGKNNFPDNALSLAGVAEPQNVYSLIQTVRAGVDFAVFAAFATEAPFSPAEWSAYLHLSGRTMQRYKKEGGTFDPLQSEKILEIMLLIKKGTAVFGDRENFNAWLNAMNVALGHVKPKDLLDSSFGINLLQEELTRIEYGVLA